MYLLKVRKRFLLAHTFFSLMVGVGGAALFHAFPHSGISAPIR